MLLRSPKEAMMAAASRFSGGGGVPAGMEPIPGGATDEATSQTAVLMDEQPAWQANQPAWQTNQPY